MKSSLIAPILPQMLDDNAITNVELGDDNIVDVSILSYVDISVGDALRLYFNESYVGYLYVVEPVLDVYPFEVNVGCIDDGVYPVYYTAVDAVGNKSVSATVSAVIKRSEDGIFPPPFFIESLDDGKIDQGESISDGGTLACIEYQNMTIGDEVVFYWYGTTEFGEIILSSIFNVTHKVSGDDVNNQKIFIFIPNPYILVIGKGDAYSWYRVSAVFPEQSGVSQIESIIINTISGTLPSPKFTEAENDGWIDYCETLDGTVVIISPYINMKVGDSIYLYVNKYDNTGIQFVDGDLQFNQIVSQSELDSGVSVLVPKEYLSNIGLGYLRSYYTVEYFDDADYGVSEATKVFVDTLHSSYFPAPVFQKAYNDVIYAEDIILESGTTLAISYLQITEGDSVYIYLSGMDEFGNNVPESSYQAVLTVEAINQQAGTLEHIIPSEYLLAVGNQGFLRCSYDVMLTNNQGYARSEYSEVKMKALTESMTSVVLTSGSPPTDKSAISLSPYDFGVVNASPGDNITISCAAGLIISETNNNYYQIVVGSDGRVGFHLSSESSGVFNVSVVNNTTVKTFYISAIFTGYRVGAGDFKAYASTTSAKADGLTPCSIYLITKPENNQKNPITRVVVTITNSKTAAIVGYQGQSSASILLNDDFSAEVNIINTVAENVTILLTLPESSGNQLSIQTGFVS